MAKISTEDANPRTGGPKHAAVVDFLFVTTPTTTPTRGGGGVQTRCVECASGGCAPSTVLPPL